MVKRDSIQALSGISSLWNLEEILKVPGVISQQESDKIFNQILSTFRFIDKIENKTVEYRGDASLVSPTYQNYLWFKKCDNEASICEHYLISRSNILDFTFLPNIIVGDQMIISGEIESRGVASGNHYFELVSDIKIQKIIDN